MSGFMTERKDERGLVSFMITLIMMMVISLIVIGFTQVANRNRREALDRQLSTQAFYAAESGVNDVLNKINSGMPATLQTTCGNASSPYPPMKLSITPLVETTCRLVDPTVKTINTSAPQLKSVVYPLNVVNASGVPSPATELSFSWSPPQNGALSPAGCTAAVGTFATTGVYACNYALLKVDVMIGSPYAGGSAGLANNTTSFYFQPQNSAPAATNVVTFGSPKAVIAGADCTSTAGLCKATLSLGATAQSTTYQVRLTSLYKDSASIEIDGKTGASSASFSGAQVSIDSTGKAGDVLRRIKVRVSSQDTDTNNLPEGGIQSQAAVCKYFTVEPGKVATDGC